MLVTLPKGGDVEIAVNHKSNKVANGHKSDGSVQFTTIHHGTIVQIKREGKTLAKGETFLHKNDTFCRRVGIKMALTRAFKTNSTLFDKDSRRVIWRTILGIA